MNSEREGSSFLGFQACFELPRSGINIGSVAMFRHTNLDRVPRTVCDPNGHWYLAYSGLTPGDLLLLTEKDLSHMTVGLRPAAIYQGSADNYMATTCGGRTLLAFRLIPQSNAILDYSPITAAGHVIPQSYVPISVSQFMDDLSTEEDMLCSNIDNAYNPAYLKNDRSKLFHPFPDLIIVHNYYYALVRT
ncbi:hypothetical protein KY289_008356 [Solanum tuberosum]|nr:hypothetical protein KY289_008356 [Solanum tuberosum]